MWWESFGDAAGSVWCEWGYEAYALVAVCIAVCVLACGIFGTMWAMFLTDTTRGVGVVPKEHYDTLRGVIAFPLFTPFATITLVLATPFMVAFGQ